MEAEQNFDAVRAMMLENFERMGFVTQIYVDMVERTMRLFQVPMRSKYAPSRHPLSGKFQPTETSWRAFCAPRIFRRPSAFRSGTFSPS